MFRYLASLPVGVLCDGMVGSVGRIGYRWFCCVGADAGDADGTPSGGTAAWPILPLDDVGHGIVVGNVGSDIEPLVLSPRLYSGA